MTNQNESSEVDKSMIVITSDDLQTQQVNERVNQMQAAQKVALIREVGAPTASSSSGSLKSVLMLLLAGLVGGVLAFALNKLSDVVLEVMGLSENTTVNNVTFTFLLAFGIGLVVSVADPLFSRNYSKLATSAAIAIPAAIVFGLIIGLIASAYYTAALDRVFERANDLAVSLSWSDAQFYDYVSSQYHLPRGIAWALVGIAAGLTVGLASRSLKRLGLAVAGGAVGGFIGGFVFDFISGEAVAQIAGIVILGGLIGGSVALLEQAAKSRWIEIAAGGMAGKQFILYQAEITIGSAPNADITLIKDPGIAPIAARVVSRGSQTTIEALNESCPVYLNGRLMSRESLSDQDIISIGSTEIRFREKSSQGAVPGAIAR
jgi:hypothetical protein